MMARNDDDNNNKPSCLGRGCCQSFLSPTAAAAAAAADKKTSERHHQNANNISRHRRRRSRPEEESAATVLAVEVERPTAILVVLDRTSAWLSRWSSIRRNKKMNENDVVAVDVGLEPNAILCYDPCVSVQFGGGQSSLTTIRDDGGGGGGADISNIVHELSSTTTGVDDEYWELKLVRSSVERNSNSNILCCDDGRRHGHAKVYQQHRLLSREDDSSFFESWKEDPWLAAAFTYTIPPLPLFSLTLEVLNRSFLPDPLQQISWKRQLVGFTILFSNEGTTISSTIHLAPGTDDVERVMTPSSLGDDRDNHNIAFMVRTIVAPKTTRGSSLFVILPSTRITLKPSLISVVEPSSGLPSELAGTTSAAAASAAASSTSSSIVVSDQMASAVPNTLSPTAQMLLDTLYCMYQGANVPRTFLLSGPPGVGKTYSVKQVLDRCPYPIHFVSLRGSELLQQQSNAAEALQREFYMAAAAITATTTTTTTTKTRTNMGVVSRAALSLIFLDECDALVSVDSMAAMLATLLDRVATEWHHVMVVGATNRIDTLPQYIRRAGRFDKELPLAPPNASERAVILSTLLLEHQHQGTPPHPPSEEEQQGKSTTDEEEAPSSSVLMDEDDLYGIAQLCVGYVPADLSALVRRAALLALQQQQSPMMKAAASSMAFWLTQAMDDVGASALRNASLTAPPKITWDDIAGDPGGAKTALRQAIEWPRTKAAAFARLGLIPPRGILLHGPPGCAKTTLARAAAGASGVAFLSLSPADVYSSSYVGEAEAVVRRAFTLARSASPCILFFDEMDAIFGGCGDQDGGGRGSSAEARVLSTFLNEMDGVDSNKRGADGVLVLGATNRPWTLDSALLRPGRLGDKIIYIPPPDKTARRAILEMQFGPESSLDLDLLASDAMSMLMTGAELVGACQEAKLREVGRAIDRNQLDNVSINQEDLVAALQSIKPLLSDPAALQEFRVFQQNG